MTSALYVYTARTSDGAFVSGTLQADTHELALSSLRVRSLFVTSLERSGDARAVATSLFVLFPIDESARVGFFRAFATLIGSGVAMRRALNVALEQCRDRRLAEAIRGVGVDIEHGTSLSAAMARRPREFTPLFVAMIRAGEIAGALEDVLERLATLLERDRALRKRVVAALSYPIVVAAAALALVVFLVATTVPAFASMFSGMHVALPASTRVLIALAHTLQGARLWMLFLAVAAFFVSLVFAVKRVPAAARAWDTTRLALPVVGALVRKTTVARIARTLGTLLKAGVPVLTALDASTDVVTLARYRDCLRDVSEALRAGHSLVDPIEQSSLFEPLVVQLVRAGEETGALDAMLLRIAEYYEIDVESALASLSSIIEPVLVIVLGAVVGTIVGSVLIPLYSLIGSIR